MGIHGSEAFFPLFYSLIQSDGDRDVQALRKGMMGELFIIFLAYMAHSFLRKTNMLNNGNNGNNNINNNNRQPPVSNIKKNFLENHVYIDERFSVYFMHHAIALGMALMWAPYEFEIAITYIHLVFFAGYVFGEIKNMSLVKTVCYAFMSLINVTLIFASLVCLGNLRSTYQ